MKRPLGLNVTEKLQLGGDGETRRGGNIRRRGMRIEAGIRICFVKAARQFRHLRRIGHRQREDRHRIVQPAGRHHAAVGQPALVGFSPTMLLNPAGTRPDPAVSVPSANGTRPRATTEAEPELEPPLT